MKYAALVLSAAPALCGFAYAPHARMEFVSPAEVRIDDAFWSPKFKVWRTVTLPDVLDKFEGRGRKDGVEDDWFANFDHVAAGERANGAHKGPHFANGLVYEAISGASDYLLSHRDPALAARLNAYAARIAAAQATEADGYLNTHNQLCHPQFKWGENGGCLVTQHEIWNLGMLIEAGVRHWRATQDTTLLACAVRAANLLCDTIGPSPRHNRVPTHSGPEEPLVLLARIFRMYPSLAGALPVKPRPDDYIALVEYWMRSRGRNCGRPEWGNDFDAAAKWISVHADEVYSADDPQRRPSWGDYAMDRIPLSEYNSIEGHAVRATLLGCGLAALARETGDDVWASAAKRFWDSMVGRKMYITGGVGALSDLERFGPDYFLPPAAYLETCAAIGSCLYSARLAELTGDGKYVDEMERVAYNALLTAVALDGHNYTYQNPLESDSHSRWDWHWCPCCPPMFLKLTGALPGYVYSRTEDGLAVNLYIAGETRQFVNGKKVKLRQDTRYPFDGKVVVTFESDADFALRLRVPGWARGIENPFGLYTATPIAAPKLKVNGVEAPLDVTDGYVALKRPWRKGDTVELTLDCSPRLVRAHPSVANVAGKVAVAAGPVVYAFEKTDNPHWESLRVPDVSALHAESRPDVLGGVNVVTDGRGCVAIPYYAVANRGTNVTFAVWAKPAGDFIRVCGTDLVDGSGRKFEIRGTNLGNWLNPEGYMFGFGSCNSAHFMDEMFRQLVGAEATRKFWKALKDNYITEADIAIIAGTGSNTVRVPFHYRLFTDEDFMDLTGPGDGFRRLDDVVGWCRAHGLRVILDMHDCPGGNTGDNIDDSYGYPDLFESDEAQALYCGIWKDIAVHFAEDPVVLGYDLMNEPIAHYFANADELNGRLEAVQFKAIDAIRSVDRNHIVIVGGGQWNSNFYMFKDFGKDANMMYECHHYAFGKPVYDDAQLVKFAAFRDKAGKPMYMGEIGHNTPGWCEEAVASMKAKNIGWTFWPYKMAGHGGWYNFSLPNGWKETVAAFAESDRSSYAKIREHRPDRALARRLMMEYAENCRAEHSRPDLAYLEAVGIARAAIPHYDVANRGTNVVFGVWMNSTEKERK